ncbi:MAG: hypothetical protein A2X36_10810 [Elusimicrobia bacterium GWA2_69_24]|nr:MAG: hypothetical protein A2X36_10810 [Elusimicrobia bacterium GWA2_69_24]HBL18476.1 hypothetical protein [Elusimicrobiota bacterium]
MSSTENQPPAEIPPPQPWYTLDITERCNADCVFCFASPSLRGTGRVSDLATVKKQISDIRRQGYGVVCFTGGEPTTHPDLAEMLRFASGLGLKAALNTNGFRFASKTYLDGFQGVFFRALVSFHSHKEAVFNRLTGTRSFRQAVGGIRNLMDRGIPVHLSHVLNKFNYQDFPGWVRYVNQHFQGVDEMGLPLYHDVFFNQEIHEPAGAMVRFKEVRPYLREGLSLAEFPIIHRNSCTASYCLFSDGFHRDPANFAEATRARNLEKLKTLPLLQQKELLNYFVPERCYACREFLAPTCKGIRKKYLLVFGHDEFQDLLSSEEKRLIETRTLPSSPHISLGAPGRGAASSPQELAEVLLRNSDHQIRREAARALGDLGPAAAGCAPALARALKDADIQTRRNAALALSKIGATAASELRRLLGALKDPDVQTRRHVAMALCALKPLPESSAKPLAAALRDEDHQVRRDSAIALADMTPVPPKATKALAAGLSDADTQTRRNCALALSRMKPPPPAAVAALSKALGDADAQVRRESSYTLGQMQPPPPRAAAALIAAMKDEDPQVRRESALALAKMTPLPSEAVPALLGAVQDPDACVRRNALRFLCGLPRLDARSAAALKAALDDKDQDVRKEAANAILRFNARHDSPA